LAGEASCVAVLQFYRKLATYRLNGVPQWEKYLLSTLAKLLDMAKTGSASFKISSVAGSYLYCVILSID
jgi:hypothetical protein